MPSDAPTPDEPTAVRRHLDVDHAAEDVWRLLATDEGLARWLGAGSRIDARPGGDLAVADAETGVHRLGRVHEVEPGRRLALRWWPEGDAGAGASEVELVLEPTATGTRVVVTERPAATPDPVRARAGGRPARLGPAGVEAAGAAWGWRLGALSLALAGRLAAVA